VLRRNRVIRPQEAFLLAEMGRATVLVYRRPRIAVLAIGSRLVPLNSELGPGQIYGSNPYFLTALCAQVGVVPENRGLVAYQSEHVKDLVEDALIHHDGLVISGGCGHGEPDLLPTALKQLGFDVQFSSVAMTPGQHTLFATREQKLVFGLPGNPLGLYVSFLLLVRASLRKMMGHAEVTPDVVLAHLRKGAVNDSEQRFYVPAKLHRLGGRWEVMPVLCESASDAFALSRADALLVLPPRSRWQSGSTAQVLRMNY